MRNIGIDLKPPTKTCEDTHCPFHGVLGVRGRIMQGTTMSVAAPKTAVIQREYLHYLDKFMRYEKRRRRIRAHLPPCLDVQVGDLVTVGECRPLTKTVSFVVLGRVSS